MYIYLSKILPLMVLPIGIVFELLVIALFLLWRRNRSMAVFFIVTAMTVLWVYSMPIVGNAMLGNLEERYPAVPLTKIPESECLVLLGGGLQPIRPPRVDVNLLDSADRISKTANLYRAGKAETVIISGGNQPWAPKMKSEAEETRELLEAWGVPVEVIVMDETSRNTHENAVNSKRLLSESSCQVPLLVTSAAHMPRAVASFASVGVEVFPVPTDVRAVKILQLNVIYFVPGAEALAMSTHAMREWTGQWIYRLRGWN